MTAHFPRDADLAAKQVREPADSTTGPTREPENTAEGTALESRVDDALGMDRRISRRDFFDGVAAAAACAALGTGKRPAAGFVAGYAGIAGHQGRYAGISPAPGRQRRYPVRTPGLGGNTPDALGVPHALRDGRFWERAGPPEATGESYDLVVVGAGISGVTAAYTWARRNPGARVLILDNHDDIGGHARRNEFHPVGRAGPLVGHGGSRSLPPPCAWSPEGRELFAALGVEAVASERYLDTRLYPGLRMHDAVFCDSETYPTGGTDRLVVLDPGKSTPRWVAELPLAAQARRDLLMLFDDPPDWFPGLSDDRKKERLAGLTYAGFLREVCRVHPEAIRFCQTMPSAAWAYGSDALGAIDAWACADRFTFPGFAGLRLDDSEPSAYNAPGVAKRWAARRSGHAEVFCFPEGNQALVRMMVGRMVPGFAGATSMEQITTTWFDYGSLDRPANRVRLRLSSPVVLVRNDGPADTAAGATVGYFDGARVKTVRASAVVMACWNMMIPYLVPDLPHEQRDAMGQAVKMPLVCATAQLRDWRAFREAGIRRVRFTGAYWVAAELAPPVSIGAYRCPGDPGEPINVHLIHAPARPGMAPREAAVAGRRALAGTPYGLLEYRVREQLARLLGPFGFDPARDIEGLTINRWGHGHAPEYARPWDTFYPHGPFPADTARRRFGRIAIANSDSVPGADADAAVSAAYRAVRDLEEAGSA